MTKSTNIVEIFSSIQGEGPYIGYRQIFVRFSGCNLICEYCDTDFQDKEFCNLEKTAGFAKFEKIKNPVSSEKLLEEISNLNKIPHHSISFTGGEPLLNTDFLSDFLPKFKNSFPEIKIYLETNGTLFEELAKIIDNIDIISMDLKLKSSTGADFPFEKHLKFIETVQKNSYKKELFAKAVITKNITDNEINELSEFINKFKSPVPLILQPISSDKKNLLLCSENIIEIQNKFLKNLNDVRVIPQVHKFLDLL